MSHSIATLLTRNLHEVFGEGDPARRRATHRRDLHRGLPCSTSLRAFTGGETRSSQIAGAIRGDPSGLPLHAHVLNRRSCIMPVASDGYLVARAEAPAYAGTDFIIARDGRIAALYLFFDALVSGR